MAKKHDLDSVNLENEILDKMNEELENDAVEAAVSSKFRGLLISKPRGIYTINIVYATLETEQDKNTGIPTTKGYVFSRNELTNKVQLAPGQKPYVTAITEHGQEIRFSTDHASYPSSEDSFDLAKPGWYTVEGVDFREEGYIYRDKEGNIAKNEEGQPYKVKYPHFVARYGKVCPNPPSRD